MVGVIGVGRDVTARVEAEADVATLRAIVYAAEEAILGVDPEGTVLFFSPSAERLYGWRAGEIIGRPVSVLVAEYRSSTCRRCSPSLRAGEIPCAATASRGAATARTSRSSSTPARSSARTGRVMQGTALIVLDISERKRAQRMLDRFIEHAPNVIAVKDLDGRYLMFSTGGP